MAGGDTDQSGLPPRRYLPFGDGGRSWPGQGQPIDLEDPAARPLLEVDRERTRYLADKRAIIAKPGRGPLRASIPGADTAIAACRDWLAAAMTTQGLDVPGAGNAPVDRLALEIQEDLVVMVRPAGAAAERARACYLHVCFPSGWDPARMLGKSYMALHAHVPREPGFDPASRRALAEQLFGAPWVRFVWGVSADARLDQHPNNNRSPWTGAEGGFVRVERQQAVPLALPMAEVEASLFLIRVYMYRFQALDSHERRMLRDSLFAMSPAMQRYKGVAGQLETIASLLA